MLVDCHADFQSARNDGEKLESTFCVYWVYVCVYVFMDCVDCHAANASRNDDERALLSKVDSRNCGGAFVVFWGFGGRARLMVCGCLQTPKICGMPTQDRIPTKWRGVFLP